MAEKETKVSVGNETDSPEAKDNKVLAANGKDSAGKDAKTTAAKGSKAVKKEKKPSLFSRIGAWFRSLRAEIKKITWANWASVRKNTIIVLVCIIVIGVALAIVDYLLSGTISGLGTLVEKL